jgi:cytochrome c-type biogenesis protein CcmH
MTTFIILAAVMALIAAAIVAYPLLREQRSRWVGALSVLLVFGAAAGLYPFWSNWDWHAPPVAPTAAGAPDIDAMVAKLEKHLADEPKDQKGWLMLGRSYSALERVDSAVAAYQHAYEIEANADAALGLAEALALQAGGQITPESGKLFEEGIVLAPTNPKAMFYGGFAAAARGETGLAKERWLALKNLNPPPPPQIVQMLDERIAQLGDSASAGTNASQTGTNTSSATSAAAQVTVNIALAADLKNRVKNDTPLFVFAREPGSSGPPLAVKRLTAAVIGTQVQLSSADSMVPSRVLKEGQKVLVTARVSFGGMPTPTAGDLYGEAEVVAGHGGVLNLTIDRVAK